MQNSLEIPQQKPIKAGDVIRLGEHLLVCGDSREVDIAAVLEGRRIDCIATDPPYAVDYVASKRDLNDVSVDKDIANDVFMTDAEYTAFSKAWLGKILPHLATKNSVYVFNSDKMVFALRQTFVELGIKPAQLLIWVKSQPVMGRLDYLPQHELVLYGWYGTHEWRRGKDKSVMFAPKPSRSTLHPTMKPVSLMRRLILNGTKIGDAVYDPFGGSGTTLIACEQTKRRCVMVETDPEYCTVIIERWKKLTGYGTQDVRRAG